MAENLEDLAYERIKVAISKGYIKKGSQLKEVSLAKDLKMSRATVKGAFKRLVHEGLAEYKLNKGVSVVNPSLDDINEAFQIRAQLEKMSTTLATENITPKDFVELHRLIREEEDLYKARELDKYYEINNAFHLKIAEKSGNRMLVHYVTELLQKTTIYLILFDPFYQILATSNPSPLEHLKIVEYLESNDAEKAGSEMQHHLESSLKGIDLNRLFPEDYLTV
ncbi:MAG: GntR family transcriptional regulator [Desulforhopalus sp.]